MDSVRDRAEFMLHLVNDLLDISHIESGRMELTPEVTDLGLLVRRAVELNQLLARPQGVLLRLTAEEQDPRAGALWLDGHKVEQVLNNLLSNAVRFSPEGGLVQVVMTCTEASLAIAVTDEGPGMEPEVLGRLFQPFQTGAPRGAARAPAWACTSCAASSRPTAARWRPRASRATAAPSR